MKKTPTKTTGQNRARLCACILASLLGAQAQGQLRIATYNTLDGPANTAEDALFQTIFGAIGTTSANGIARPVDILALQEQAGSGASSTAQRAAAALNSLYGVSDYQAEVIDTGFDSLAYVYNSASVDVVSSQLVPVGIRPGHRVAWRPTGYTADSAVFYTYNVHLKAGSTDSDFNRRATETTNLRNNADALGPDANVIYLGDFNVQSPTDAAVQNLFASGNGQAVDPLGLNITYDGIARAIHHTQSTRTSPLADRGSTGGVDDRFDIQFVSGEVLDGNGFNYIGPSSADGSGLVHSYKAFGNDGTSFNGAINTNLSNRSQPVAVLNALHDLSDHLPVIADYQLPAKAQLTVTTPNTRVIAGEPFAVFANVQNVAPVTQDVAADALDYTLSGSGDAFVALGPFTGSLQVTDAPGQHLFGATAPAAGETFLNVTLQSNDEGAINSEQTERVNLVGLDHALPSFASGSTVKTLTIDFGQVNLNDGEGTLSDFFFVVNNEQTQFFTADLVIDEAIAISGDTDIFEVPDFSTQITAGSLAAGQALFDTTTAGDFSAVFHLPVSDEDVLGAASSTLVLNLIGEVLADILPGDANGDGMVSLADLDILGQNFGGSGDFSQGDFNGDGQISLADLDILGQNFGTSSGDAASVAAVPEPTSLALLGLGGLLVARRRSR